MSKMKIKRRVIPDIQEPMDADVAKPRRALQSDINIAFTAYMDHDENNLGAGQALVYNQVLLNDGNGYNKHSGMFTAPVAGVYSFTFFVGQRGVYEERSALYVSSDNTVDAIVDTNAGGEDGQGGNSATLKVAAGDVVYVKSLYGSHLEGSTGSRYTTFSGFLLYPASDDVVPVGK